MKYLKTYENNESAYVFVDKYKLKIHKIKSGPNKDKILFKFFNKETETYNYNYSLLLGCAKILDTKYKNNPDVLNIEIGGMKFRKVQYNTAEAIIKLFLKDFKYSERQSNYRVNYKYFVNIFQDKMQNILKKDNNIGELLNDLKKLKKDIIKEQELHLYQWEINKDINKYNL